MYVNFNQRLESFHDVSEWGWPDQGLELYRRFVPEIADTQHEAMAYGLSMTRMTFGTQEELDTSIFRQSIQVYLQHIHGLRDESFPYRHVNQMLTVAMKSFIKSQACKPQTITAEDYASMSGMFSEGEKLHVSVIVMETKKQIELTFLSKVVN